MQRCPKCGYHQRLDWPALVSGLVSYVVCAALIFGTWKPKYREIGFGALLLFSLVRLWMMRDGNSEHMTLFANDGNEGPKLPSQ